VNAPTHDLQADSYLVTHEVGPNQQGIRLDHFLKDRYRKRSREQLQRAIESGAITVKRPHAPHMTVGKLKASTQLMVGDEVLVLSERKPEPEVNFNYRILFEDDVLFVIEKPANLPVHPAGRYFFNTLLVHLKTHGHKDPLKMEREFFLIHRIDKETSGILVLAKDRDACTHITRQFAERSPEKTYLAIARGITPEEFEIDVPMGKAPDARIELKMSPLPVEQGGQTALTRFKRIDTAGDFSLVECYPKTGRQHQIRVHLECAGHPIVGDKLYGLDEAEGLRYVNRQYLSPEAEARLLLPRHALHASGIKFWHPVTGQRMEFRCELPEDLRAFLESRRAVLHRAQDAVALDVKERGLGVQGMVARGDQNAPLA
jgi:23S rRNA pseudouridine1911/1915/1917 synthase